MSPPTPLCGTVHTYKYNSVMECILGQGVNISRKPDSGGEKCVVSVQ